MATCIDFQEVIFRPFELIAFDQQLVHMKCCLAMGSHTALQRTY
jgi:hypothetical protein